MKIDPDIIIEKNLKSFHKSRRWKVYRKGNEKILGYGITRERAINDLLETERFIRIGGETEEVAKPAKDIYK